MELVKKLFDFRELELPEPLFQPGWSAGAVDALLEAVRGRFLTIEETEGPLQAGDFAVFALEEAGETVRVQVNVGRRLCGAAFEDSLTGLTPGDEVTMPDGRRGRLVQLKRRVYPPLSDALAARMGIEGVETVESYRQWEIRRLLAEDRRKKSNAIFAMVMEAVCERSAFADLTGEVERRYQESVARLRREAGEQGRSYEEALSDFVPEKYKTLEEKEAYWHDEIVHQVKVLAVGQAYLKQTGRVLDRKSYEQYRQEMLDQETPPEAIASFENYLSYQPVMIYDNDVMDYFSARFKEVEKP